MSRPRSWLARLFPLIFLLGGCQDDPSSVQPEALAPSAAASAPATGVAPAAAPSAAPSDAVASDAASDPSSPDPIPSGAAQAPSVAPPGTNPAPSPETKPPPKKTAAKAGSHRGQAKIELVQAGVEPRKELRFFPKVGLVDELTMTMTLAMGFELGEKSIPKSALPPMVMAMDLKVTEVRPNGDIRYDFTVTSTDVKASAGTPAQLVEPMEKALGRLRGLGGHAVVSNRGESKEAKVNLPKGLDQQTQQILQGVEQAMNQVVVALPEEPVGKGAQWKVTTPIEQNGIELTQVFTYDLVELDGDVAHCNVTVAQRAPRQKIAGPGGAVVDLTALKSSGKGKVVLRLDHVAPGRSDLALGSALEMGAQGKSMKVETDMKVEMRSP